MAQALSTEPAKPPRRAFISHATADDSYVAEMEAFLRAAGYDDVFNDASAIRPDEQFWPAIAQGITDCEALVVVITAASNVSNWVTREVTFARSLGRKVIPVWIEDCPVSALFADRDVIDFRPRRRAERRLDIGRIFQYAPEALIGRDAEKALISDAWARALRAEAGRPHILTFVALGGEGKTSLVAKWAIDELLDKGWPGCEAAFAWSFYSQGTRDQVAASSDVFLKAALDFFADDDADRTFAASAAGAYEKGQRLARRVGSQRSLLILDGLEPLQYAPSAPTPGELKDQGIAALLKGLAQQSQGLCLVTTRYSVPDLKAFRQSTAPEHDLKRLSTEAGTHLLTTLHVKGPKQELQATVEEVKGHALTLQLLGTWLHDAHAGDIRQRHLVKLEEADAEEQGGHAFRVMAAYETSFEREGASGRRALALLRLLGLFDRPVTADCFHALLKSPVITGLTDPLQGLSTPLLNKALSRLESARLLTVYRDGNTLLSLDAHPLLREYFARQLREQQPDAWRAAHGRLFEHLCASTKEGEQPTLEDLQPLYQAVAHGCLAGLQQRACEEVYHDRVLKGTGNDGFYSTNKLGAFGSDLGAVACFFDQPWQRVSPALTDVYQAWLLNQAAFRLRALGRLTEALEPMRAGLEMRVQQEVWKSAAIIASNLSELALTLGEVAAAVQDAEQSVTHADRSGDAFQRLARRTSHADALHQAGRRAEALQGFREAEQMQQEDQPDYPLLYSLRGFQYADLLLAAPERAAWQAAALGQPGPAEEAAAHHEALQAVGQRAAQTLEWATAHQGLLDIALDHLTLARTALFTALLTQAEPSSTELTQARREADAAVAGLRRAGRQDYLPLGLLTRAWLRAITGPLTGPDSAQADLDEAWDIAERGPMRLYMADIHLYRARLFCRAAPYPWQSPEADLAAARELIERCGYGRRREELEDAEAALAQWRRIQLIGPT